MAKTCSIDGCDKTAHARGWCITHYRRWRVWGDVNRGKIVVAPLDRFMAFVRKQDNGCWEWTGSKDRGGYGRFSYERKPVLAHRWIHEKINGPVPDGLQLDHLCRNRSCVNPNHLEVVTQRENMMRGDGPSAKHARKTHCTYGHEFTEENTYRHKGNRRMCRTCMNRRHRERSARTRAAREVNIGWLLEHGAVALEPGFTPMTQIQGRRAADTHEMTPTSLNRESSLLRSSN